jgi:hypothetical protein
VLYTVWCNSSDATIAAICDVEAERKESTQTGHSGSMIGLQES